MGISTDELKMLVKLSVVMGKKITFSRTSIRATKKTYTLYKEAQDVLDVYTKKRKETPNQVLNAIVREFDELVKVKDRLAAVGNNPMPVADVSPVSGIENLPEIKL
jgi:hypothetical protein